MSSSSSLHGPNTAPISASSNGNSNSSENNDIVSDHHHVSVVIVGAGPSGIATSALLNSYSVPNLVFEREDCCASLWKKRSYDRLNLHLAKGYCSLPLMPHSFRTSTFMSKDDFIAYIDEYVSRFNVNPRYCRHVDSAVYDEDEEIWKVKVTGPDQYEYYSSDFLVVATGENSQAIIPADLPGLESFTGKVVHACDYKNGESFKDKQVLVIGCGNSGMEISNDLADNGAHASLVIRSQMHVLSKEMVAIGMLLLDYLPVKIVDKFVLFLAKFRYQDLSSYGIHHPDQGPFLFKALTGKTPVIDRGTINKIRSKQIKVFPGIVRINSNSVEFNNGARQSFDAILLATGYKSVAHKWLKDYKYLLNDDGKPKGNYPNHWKGEKGVYCVGLAGNGLPGIFKDSTAVAEDIYSLMAQK
ncbi:probable indole-3-pyruvate monooxygenase YUCCA10 [Pyrus x bretschneideri]|nr:probable indole-3-pyruvate monooxygenase YUCCA10 [Pyrus x bretschneideri]